MITVNGKEVAYEEGMTVKRLLEIMNYTFPMIIVRVNGKLVLREDWDTFVIPPEAKVQALHQIAGG
jgi:sulfur carrier protein